MRASSSSNVAGSVTRNDSIGASCGLLASLPRGAARLPGFMSPPSIRQTSAVTEATRDVDYYCNCALGGAVASSVRWILTPLEVLKGYRQVNMMPASVVGIAPGLTFVYHHEGIRGLFKGLGPTAVAYSIQASMKFALYEYLRDRWSMMNSRGAAKNNAPPAVVCVSAAACAEACASTLMFPFERIRVRVQTESYTPKLPRNQSFNFRGLGPLLARQVPGTIVNMYTFENTVQFFYRYILTHPKEAYSPMSQLSVTLASGYIAGKVCAVASHPADSLLSLLVKNPTYSLGQIVESVGWFELMTRGLAPRVVTVGTIIAGQWYLYDCFKTIMGMGTSGG